VTLVAGYALDPESSAPLAGREVTAVLLPAGSSVSPIDGGTDRAFSATDGRWELNLPPTAGTGSYYRVREWLNRTYYIDVPDSTHIEDVTTLVIDPGTGQPPPPNDPLYVTRAELGQPSGVATLGSDGKLALDQRPAGSGSATDAVLTSGVAGTTLSGHIVVHPRASDGLLVAATADNLAHVNVPLWMTTGAALNGDAVDVLTFGDFVEPSWSWITGGPIYLGLHGEITQTPPSAPVSLFLVQLGFATSPTSIFFDRGPSIQLI
jgi:hypothetical protein